MRGCLNYQTTVSIYVKALVCAALTVSGIVVPILFVSSLKKKEGERNHVGAYAVIVIYRRKIIVCFFAVRRLNIFI